MLRRWLKKLRAKQPTPELPHFEGLEELVDDTTTVSSYDSMVPGSYPLKPPTPIKVTSPLSEMFGVKVPVRIANTPTAYGKLQADKQAYLSVLKSKLRSY